MFVFMSRYVMFNIFRSIFDCAAGSLFFAWLVSVPVSAPYVITEHTHEFVDLSLRVLPLKMSQCLATAVHLAVIFLRRIFLRSRSECC